MKPAEILTAAGLLLVSTAAIIAAVSHGAGWGDVGPQPGFFPFWLALILGLSSVWGLGQAVLRPAGPRGAEPALPAGARRRVLTVLLPMVAAFLLVELAGFYVAALLYLLVYIRLTGQQSWKLAVAVSLLFPLAVFLVFGQWFRMPLPRGVLDDLLPF
ncbi:MAG: tripartite tricarboxylate transporter TctB family protein [Candidatus Rokuibacteriota bacterium]